MNIRIANIDDLEKVARLFNDYRIFYGEDSDLPRASKFLEERFQKKDSVIILCINDQNEGMGFIQLYSSFTSVGMSKIWLLNDLYVDEKHRKKGVAKKLMDKAKSYCQETGRPKIILETGSNNLKAQKLYESIGYSKENTINYFLNV